MVEFCKIRSKAQTDTMNEIDQHNQNWSKIGKKLYKKTSRSRMCSDPKFTSGKLTERRNQRKRPQNNLVWREKRNPQQKNGSNIGTNGSKQTHPSILHSP